MRLGADGFPRHLGEGSVLRSHAQITDNELVRLATSLVAGDNLTELRVHVGFPKPGFDRMMNFPQADALEGR